MPGRMNREPFFGRLAGLDEQRLSADARRALRDPEPEDAAAAVEQLVDLACEMRGYDYFRSEDAVESARFVVSDVVALLCAGQPARPGRLHRVRRAGRSPAHRWESRHRWTAPGSVG